MRSCRGCQERLGMSGCRDLMTAKGEGRDPKLLADLAKVDVLLVDDWAW